MKARPLFQKGIVELERMFNDSQHDHVTLRQLRAELKHRKLARAFVLLKKVEVALEVPKRLFDTLPAATQALDLPSSSIEGPGRSSSTGGAGEHGDNTKATRTVIAVSAHQQVMGTPDTNCQLERTERRLKPTVPVSQTFEQACGVLGVASSSSWEVIEQARRTLVERARPDRVADLNEEQRKKRQSEAQRVNQEYATLARARMRKGDITLQ